MKEINNTEWTPVQIASEITVQATGEINDWRSSSTVAIPTSKAKKNEVIVKTSQIDMARELGVHPSYVSACVIKRNTCKGYRLFRAEEIGECFFELSQKYNTIATEKDAKTKSDAEDAAKWRAYQAELRAKEEAERERQRRIEELKRTVEVRKQLAEQIAAKLANAQESVRKAEAELATLQKEV